MISINSHKAFGARPAFGHGRLGSRKVQLHLLQPLAIPGGPSPRRSGGPFSDESLVPMLEPMNMASTIPTQRPPRQPVAPPTLGGAGQSQGEEPSRVVPRRSQQQVQSSQLFDLEGGEVNRLKEQPTGRSPQRAPSQRTTQKLPGRHSAFYRPSPVLAPKVRKPSLARRLQAFMDSLTPALTALVLMVCLIVLGTLLFGRV